MSLRLPLALRERVRRFAAARGLEEATAVRTLCAERLQELELSQDLLIAERWQFARALETWEQWERGALKPTDPGVVRDIFAGARARVR